MVIAFVGLALAMIAGGAWAALQGYEIIIQERGWTLLIAGVTVAGIWMVLLGITAAVARLGAIRGGGLRGGVVDVRGDHRLAFAFGVLGLVVPGVVLRGAESIEKSHPEFLHDLLRAGGQATTDG